MSRPSNIVITTIKRNQRFRGPSSSEQQNDFQAEVIKDFTSFQQEWNNKIVPLTSKLPDGVIDSTVNAFANGLDGQTLYANADATISLTSGRYWKSTPGRPNTIFEQFVNLYTYVDDAITTLETSIETSNFGGGLTAGQKTSIGDNIFDNNIASASNSLDGKTKSHAGYITQIARDLYGELSPTLNSNGNTILINSVKTMVNALLELHNGSWDNDASLSHTISASNITSGTLGQHIVGPSSGSPEGQDDTYTGTPTNALQDFNQIRRLLKQFKGTVAFTSTITPDGTWSGVTTSPDSFVDLISLKGTGTRSNNNPWGYSYSDIENLSTVLGNIRDFVGQDAIGDSSPAYSELYDFSQGSALTSAISALASGLNAADLTSITISNDLDNHLLDSGNPHNVTLTQVSSEGGTAPALQISIVDNGGYFTTATAEEALQELAVVDGIIQSELISLSGLLTDEINTLADEINTLETNLENFVIGISGHLANEIVVAVNNVSGILRSDLTALEIDLSGDISNLSADISNLSGDISNLENSLDSNVNYILVNSGFRRLEYFVTGLADDDSVEIVHSGGMYPQVQVVTFDTVSTVNHSAGSILPIYTYAHATDHPGVYIVHDNINTLTFTNKLDTTLASGVVICQW